LPIFSQGNPLPDTEEQHYRFRIVCFPLKIWIKMTYIFYLACQTLSAMVSNTSRIGLHFSSV
jgi:hypothetical protein